MMDMNNGQGFASYEILHLNSVKQNSPSYKDSMFLAQMVCAMQH